MNIMQAIYDRIHEIAESHPSRSYREHCVGWMNHPCLWNLRREMEGRIEFKESPSLHLSVFGVDFQVRNVPSDEAMFGIFVIGRDEMNEAARRINPSAVVGHQHSKSKEA